MSIHILTDIFLTEIYLDTSQQTDMFKNRANNLRLNNFYFI